MKRKHDENVLTAKNHIWTGEEIINLLDIYHQYYGSGVKAAKALGICPSYFYAAKAGRVGVGPKFCRGLQIKRVYQYSYDEGE